MTVPAETVIKKVAAKKLQSSKKAASSGQKTAQKVAATRPQTSAGSSPRAAAPKSGAKSQAVVRVKQTGTAAKTKAKTEIRSAVQSSKQSRARTKTAVSGKYRTDKVLGLTEMRPKTRSLSAEYLAALIMAVILLFVGGKDNKTYHERMSRFFIQITGISGIFFFMSLASSSPKAAKFTVPFGLLLDLSMLAFVMKEGGALAIQKAVGKIPQEPLPNQPGDKTDIGNILQDLTSSHSTPLLPGGFSINPVPGEVPSSTTGPGLIETPGNKSVLTPPGKK